LRIYDPICDISDLMLVACAALYFQEITDNYCIASIMELLTA
jgi:hypothetical protein